MQHKQKPKHSQSNPSNKWLKIVIIVLALGLIFLLIRSYFSAQVQPQTTKRSEISVSQKIEPASNATNSTRSSETNSSSSFSSEHSAVNNYAVDLKQLLRQNQAVVFEAPTIDAPNWIEIQTRENSLKDIFLSVAFVHNPKVATWEVTIRSIPPKQIRVFSSNSSDSQVRTVKVATEVTLGKQINQFSDNTPENTYASKMGGDKFYLFYNNHGSVSLVTPNYAGNVATKEDLSIMSEYQQTH
ncbi:hypothetical protein KG086_09225 [Lacticaseibacillus chiayiensis]|uniref:hypothetical protein n=1 Tax=Lacticaseibacillus chiayiensis TaxID=2100821 RepID=UPI001BCF2ED8|nr:hypothetical protein [Lacticaseibacillus chiayiensis]QVI33976.1 hypothetical protein KG086_09225 [Lacticaseibacillus chiayiensis]